MPDYSKGQIYMIESASAELIYYGSTCTPLRKRLWCHKSKHKKYLETGTGYNMTAFQVLKHPDARILLVEDFPCANRKELCRQEGKWIRENKCVNKHISGRTIQEWNEDNKSYFKDYRKANKAKIQAREKKYREDNRAYKNALDKKYRENNKESISASKKISYEKNKEAINARRREKVVCQCGATITKAGMSRHKHSAKHKAALSN
jgi:hypothetical protein